MALPLAAMMIATTTTATVTSAGAAMMTTVCCGHQWRGGGGGDSYGGGRGSSSEFPANIFEPAKISEKILRSLLRKQHQKTSGPRTDGGERFRP